MVTIVQYLHDCYGYNSSIYIFDNYGYNSYIVS